MESRVQWNSRVACGNRAQVRRHPPWMIGGEYSDAGSRFEALVAQPSPDGLGHVPGLCKRVTLYVLAALDLKRGVFRPALSALGEHVIKGGHGVSGNIPEIECLARASAITPAGAVNDMTASNMLRFIRCWALRVRLKDFDFD